MPKDNLSNLIISLQKDFKGFKKEILELKKDFGGFKNDLSDLKNEFKGFKKDLTGLKEEFYEFRNETTDNFNEVHSKLDNHTVAIMSLENTIGFYGDMYKMNKEKIDNHENRISILEAN